MCPRDTAAKLLSVGAGSTSCYPKNVYVLTYFIIAELGNTENIEKSQHCNPTTWRRLTLIPYYIFSQAFLLHTKKKQTYLEGHG